MAQHPEETRLDRLWQAVAETDAHADWLRFYEGFAAARLIVPLEGQDGPRLRLRTLPLASGKTALAFDAEARFAAFIDGPTEHVALTGAELARLLAPQAVAVALNPGVAPGETVIDAGALNWIAQNAAAGVEAAPAQGGLRPLPDPEPALLEALGLRLAEMGGAVAEAWLAAPEGRDETLCVLCLDPSAAALAEGIAADLTRTGQLRSARPFAVALAAAGSRLLAEARRSGIGLAAHPLPDE